MLALVSALILAAELGRSDSLLGRAAQAHRREMAAAAGVPPTSPPQRAADTADRAALALARLELAEPTIEEVQAAAVAHAGIDPVRIESWRGRSRLAPLLPKLTAEYRHDERTYRAVGLQGGSEVDYLRSTPGDTLGVRASWSLDELVFSRGELQVAALTQQLMRRREELVERVTRLYYERRRLRIVLALAQPADVAERAERELEIDAATARLDALTGGLFAAGGAR